MWFTKKLNGILMLAMVHICLLCWSVPVFASKTLTARQCMSLLDSVLKTIAPDGALISCSSKLVDTNGYALNWSLTFSSAIKDSSYFFHTDSTAVILDKVGGVLNGSLTIAPGWINSDTALGIAEKNAGKIFRKTHPQCTISVALGGPLVPPFVLYWTITYQSAADRMALRIDAITGAVGIEHGIARHLQQIPQLSFLSSGGNIIIQHYAEAAAYGRVTLFSTDGQKLEILYNGHLRQGQTSIPLQKKYRCGVYIVRANTGVKSSSMRIVVTR